MFLCCHIDIVTEMLSKWFVSKKKKQWLKIDMARVQRSVIRKITKIVLFGDLIFDPDPAG